jgi:hypothetical protein
MKKQLILILTFSTFSFIACDRDNDPLPVKNSQGNTSHVIVSAPASPVVITSFYPQIAKPGVELAIFGENFGQTISDNYVTLDGIVTQIVQIPYHGLILVCIPLNLAPGAYTIKVSANGQTGTSIKKLQVMNTINTVDKVNPIFN